MKSKILHTNINVLDLERSLAFYVKALGLHETRRKDREGYTLSFISDDAEGYEIELTCLSDRKEPYDLGDNETHIAFQVEDFDASHKLHGEMGCICYENLQLGVYFIEDPDGYWLEIVPKR
ncbi:MAG: VOC family protein [Synergistaceae bacterium]|jgi:lactoylglutathione lyase|nr:VOC family protein [Synergistaceae bacterium]